MIGFSRSGPRAGLLVATSLSVAALAGCGGSDTTSTSTVTETVETSTSTSQSTTVSTSSSTASTAEGATPPADLEVTKLTGFTSPTGNIGCYIDQKSVRCDISKRQWDPPGRPASCNENVDYGQGIQMAAGGAPKFVCAGDTALGGGDPLPYGQSIGAGLLRCESAESGMTCRDTETGRGFMLSIGSYDLF